MQAKFELHSEFESPERPVRAARAELALILTFVLMTLGCSLFYNGNDLFLYEIAAIAAITGGSIALYRNSGSALHLSAPGLAFAAFFLWSALAVQWSQVPYVSLVELGSLASGIAMYIIWRAYNRDSQALPTDKLLIALGFALAIAMLGQHAAGFEPAAMFLNRNSAAGFLNLLWPTAAVGWLALSSQAHRRLTLLVLVALSILAISLTGSRGALLGTISGLAVVSVAGVLALRKNREVMLLLLVAGAVMMLSNHVTSGDTASGVASLSQPGSAGSTRFVIWRAAWDMIQEKPWLGWGPGVFFLAYPAFRLPADRSGGYFVHNDYLEFWLERGIPGLLLVLTVAVSVCWLFSRYMKNCRNREIAHTSGGAIATFAALSTLAVHCMFTYSLQLMPFIATLGILLAELERTTSAPTSVRLSIPQMRGRPLAVAALIGLTAIPIWGIASHGLYFHIVERGIAHFSAANFERAAGSFAQARALWRLPDSAWYLQANTYLTALRRNDKVPNEARRKLVSEAAELLEGAKKRNPLRPTTPLILGLLRSDHPDLVAGFATDALERAVRLDPRSVEARYALSQVLQRRGDAQGALDVIAAGFGLTYPDYVDTTPLVRRYRHLQRDPGSPATSSPSTPTLDQSRTALEPTRSRP